MLEVARERDVDGDLILGDLVIFKQKYSRDLVYSGDLNSKLFWYSYYGDLLDHGMVHYSDAWYHDSSVFKSPFG